MDLKWYIPLGETVQSLLWEIFVQDTINSQPSCKIYVKSSRSAFCLYNQWHRSEDEFRQRTAFQSRPQSACTAFWGKGAELSTTARSVAGMEKTSRGRAVQNHATVAKSPSGLGKESLKHVNSPKLPMPFTNSGNLPDLFLTANQLAFTNPIPKISTDSSNKPSPPSLTLLCCKIQFCIRC